MADKEYLLRFWNIPSLSVRSKLFQKMLERLLLKNIITETDAPLGTIAHTRNYPGTVAPTVKLLAQLRGLSIEEARDAVFANYRRLFCS